MFAASNETVRVPKPSITRQAKAVVQELQPLPRAASWEDAVAAVSVVLFAATLIFLVVVG
jgi:hypothetical protein